MKLSDKHDNFSHSIKTHCSHNKDFLQLLQLKMCEKVSCLSDGFTKTSWSWTLVLPLAKHCEFLECLVFMKLSDKYDTFPHTIKHTAPTTKTFCSSSSSRLVEKGPNFDPFLLSLFPYPFHKGTNCPCYHNRQASPVLSPSLTLGTHAQRGL